MGSAVTKDLDKTLIRRLQQGEWTARRGNAIGSGETPAAAILDLLSVVDILDGAESIIETT